MGETLYYKLLEAILVSEKAKGKPLDNLLSQELFHKASSSRLHENIALQTDLQILFRHCFLAV